MIEAAIKLLVQAGSKNRPATQGMTTRHVRGEREPCRDLGLKEPPRDAGDDDRVSMV